MTIGLRGTPVRFPARLLQLAGTMAKLENIRARETCRGIGTCFSVAGNSASAAPAAPPSQPDMLSPHPLHLSLGSCQWQLHGAVAELMSPRPGLSHALPPSLEAVKSPPSCSPLRRCLLLLRKQLALGPQVCTVLWILHILTFTEGV